MITMKELFKKLGYIKEAPQPPEYDEMMLMLDNDETWYLVDDRTAIIISDCQLLDY